MLDFSALYPFRWRRSLSVALRPQSRKQLCPIFHRHIDHSPLTFHFLSLQRRHRHPEDGATPYVPYYRCYYLLHALLRDGENLCCCQIFVSNY
jgi:hypothetical protein